MHRTPIRTHVLGYSPMNTDSIIRMVTPDRSRPLAQPPPQSLSRISSLQSQLDKQRKKTKALESSLLNSSMQMRNLQLQVARLQVQSQQCSELMTESKKKNDEILYYQDCLELIKKEVEHLNQTLLNRNNQYHVICEELELLKAQNGIINADKSDLTRILGRGLEMINQICRQFAIELPVKSDDPLDQLRLACDGITKLIKNLQEECAMLVNVNAQVRREYSQKLIKQKQRSVKLQYQKKLLEDRKQDNDRQAQLKAADDKDRRIQALELRLIYMEQESQRKLQQISMEKFNMEDKLRQQNDEKENTIVEQSQTLMKRIKDLEREKRELKNELEKIREKYRSITQKYSKVNFEVVHSKSSNDYLQFMKQLRQYEEEKKASQIRMEEILFQNRVLQQELALYRSSNGH